MPSRPSAGAVIFDLDGTLVQTRGASWDVFRKISDEFELGLTGPQEYFALFHGNIFASLDALCRGRADSEQVRRAFMARLRQEYNPVMIPGMVDVIRRLAGNCTLAVMSSNAMEVLRRVLVANDIAYCFAHVFGGDVTPDKAAAIRSFLSDTGSRYGRRCEVAYDETPALLRPDPSTTVLVTDTAGDVRDAIETGIRAVGVAWGMHSSDELSEAGAEFVAIWPQELPGYLLGDDAAAPTGACAVPAGGCAGPAGGCAGPAADPPTGQPAGGYVVSAVARPAGACAVSAAERLPGECACGCSGPVATRLTAAAAIRRGRRQRAVQAAVRSGAAQGPVPSRPPVPPVPAARPLGQGAWPQAQAAPAAELRDAVRRIMQSVPGG